MRGMLRWSEWNPGLDNDHLTLREVLDTLPAAKAEQIPWQVRALENPSSPIAFPGAISLQHHDAIHVLLGRGLFSQDEAFVIGYTMGAAAKIRHWHVAIYRFVASHLYPKTYRFKHVDLTAFDLGFALGQRGRARDLHRVDFENHEDHTLARIRGELGIDILALHSAYRLEGSYIPETSASRRLDKDYGGLDPSHLQSPDAPDSDWKRDEKSKP